MDFYYYLFRNIFVKQNLLILATFLSELMLFFWKLIHETQNLLPLEATRHHNSIKLLFFLPLRADLLCILHYETPCKQDLYLFLTIEVSKVMGSNPSHLKSITLLKTTNLFILWSILLCSTKEKNPRHGRMIPFFRAIETGTNDFCSSPYLGMSNKIKQTVANLSKHN